MARIHSSMEMHIFVQAGAEVVDKGSNTQCGLRQQKKTIDAG